MSRRTRLPLRSARLGERARPAALSPREVLLERARKYARVPAVEQADSGTECLGFARSGESYLIETRYVIEVASRAVTRLPGAPPALLGLVNLRGEILPVFDLALVLGRGASAPPGDDSPLIVLGHAHAEVAICAEALHGSSRLTELELVDERPARALVRAVTKDARVVLDGRALLEGSALSLDATSSPTTGSEVAS